MPVHKQTHKGPCAAESWERLETTCVPPERDAKDPERSLRTGTAAREMDVGTWTRGARSPRGTGMRRQVAEICKWCHLR